MDDETFTISVPADTEGFVSFDCPYCERRFKLRVEDYEAEDVVDLFCPLCGLKDEPGHFLSKDVMEAATALVTNYALDQINDMFKGIERSFRGSKHVTVKQTGSLDAEPEKVLSEEDDLEQSHFACCKKDIKVQGTEKSGSLYCPYCGEAR